MIRATDIRDAIIAAATPLRFVGTARDFSSVQEATIVWPSAWVIPLTEASGANRFQHAHVLSQQVTSRFGVVLAIRDIADRTGTRALSEAEEVRATVIEALARFRPPGAETTCHPVSGRLLGGIGAEGRMFWQDDFQAVFDRHLT